MHVPARIDSGYHEINARRGTRREGRHKVRLTKMFGLAALAAVAAMAFVGVTSASATNTVLCKNNANLVCETANKIEHATVTWLATNSTFLSSLANVLCTHSIISGKVLLLANPLVGHIELIDFTTCEEDTFGTECTVNTNNAGLLKLLKTGPNAGSLHTEGAEFLVDCPEIGLHCVYGFPITAIGVAGSVGTALAIMTVSNAQVVKKRGFFCPNETRWDATYSVTTPDPVYIAE